MSAATWHRVLCCAALLLLLEYFWLRPIQGRCSSCPSDGRSQDYCISRSSAWRRRDCQGCSQAVHANRVGPAIPSTSRRARAQMPKATDTVKVNYHGWLDGGKVFDSSYDRNTPISFPLNGRDQRLDRGDAIGGRRRHDRIGSPCGAGLRRPRRARHRFPAVQRSTSWWNC